MQVRLVSTAGGPVTKRYDPLWELVDEKIGLQGQGVDVDVKCPRCHVVVHLGSGTKAGARFSCGLCGATFVVGDGVGEALLADVDKE
jgi:ribosomal protein S27AE